MPSEDRTFIMSFVFGSSKSSSCTSFIFPSLILAERRHLRANLLIFLGIDWRYERGLGPKTTPPPLRRGNFISPLRALPVCFCAYSFLVLPLTSPLPLVDA